MTQSQNKTSMGGLNLVPAMHAKMGKWDYYIARMQMIDVAEKILFAGDMHEADSLDAAIQRKIDESRAKFEIAEYLMTFEEQSMELETM